MHLSSTTRSIALAILLLGARLDAGGPYTYTVDAPSELSLRSGETASMSAMARLAIAPGEPGVEAWSISLTTDGPCAIVGASTAGTAGADAASDPAGRRQDGFEFTEIVDPALNDGRGGVVSGVVLSFLRPLMLEPAGSPFDVLSLTVEATAPDGPEPTEDVVIRFLDGLRGAGEPVRNRVSTESGFATLSPEFGEAVVSLRVEAITDCNGNGVADALDLSSGESTDCNGNGVPDECDVAPVPAFSAPLHLALPAGTTPDATAVADLDGDGDVDLAVAGATGLSVFLNEGHGAFSPHGTHRVGAVPVDVAGDDLDADGDVDLVTANSQSASVSVLLNDGAAGFRSVEYPVGETPVSIATGDLDLDGDTDLVVANYVGNTVSLLSNDGSGHFSDRVDYEVGENPVSVVAPDIDGDGDLDIVVAHFAGRSVIILQNDGTGSLGDRVDLDLGEPLDELVAGDLDSDGDADLAAIAVGAGVRVLWNDGEASSVPAFSAELLRINSDPRSLLAGDLDDDGDTDLAVLDETAETVTVLLNRGGGVLEPAVIVPIELGQALGAISNPLSIGDVDGDGRTDIVVAARNFHRVAVLLGQTPPSSADADGDGVPDECGGRQRPGDANQDGHFDISDPVFLLDVLFGGSGRQLPCEGAGRLALSDWNGDGAIDISDAVAELIYLFLSGREHPLGAACVVIAGCPDVCGAE